LTRISEAPIRPQNGVKPAEIPADSVCVRIRRTLKRLVAWLIVAATLIATGPTIWHDAIANLQTYLHASKSLAMAIVVVPISLVVLIVVFVRVRNWLTVQRQHRAVRQDALRNLRL
jgi:hypothetical protein